MRFYGGRHLISAPPDRVWEVLTDAEALVAADTGVIRLDGTIAAGERITVWSAADPGRGFPVRVREYAAPTLMTWEGGLPLGAFRGVRRFRLVPENGSTAFQMREDYTGPLAPLIWRTTPDLQPSFDRFARGLAAAAEAVAR